jgi:hypothetical protein
MDIGQEIEKSIANKTLSNGRAIFDDRWLCRFMAMMVDDRRLTIDP